MRKGQLFIDGEWVDRTSTFTSMDPSTGQPLGLICQGTEEDINSAVAAAKKAFPEWRARGVEERARILAKVVDLLIAAYGEQGEVTELKKLIMDEMGKRLPEADIEVIESSDMLAYFVKEAPELLQPRLLRLNQELWPNKKSHVIFEPLGVVGVIKPWNYPLELPIWAIGPALVAGNTVVFKPSEHSSLVGLEIGKLFAKAGLPKGVLNVVTGEGETGRFLVEHDDVAMIAFTGSVPVGRGIAVECAKRLRKYSLELGGNDAAIVQADVDLELAANGLVWGAFCNSGQVCVRTKRAFVDQKIVADLTRRIVERTRALRLNIDFGPIVSETQLSKIEEQVRDAVDKGAKILVGGERVLNQGGYFYSPTVLTNVTSSMNIMIEECFGPVLPLTPVSNAQEAIELANNTQYGLGASVWTSDLVEGVRIAERLEAGMVWVNDVNVAYAEAPWGGVKQSGPGVELSEWGLYEFVNRKHVNLDLTNDTRREWWYPYTEVTKE
jgi:acyl-CoA reductase-like NAD-dependent aldehyde dehydrogenase